MKTLLLLIATSIMVISTFGVCAQPTQSRKSRNDIVEARGFFFRYKDHVYFTEHLNTTYPQFLVKWKNQKDEHTLCISDISGRCPSYVVEFTRQSGQHGEVTLTNVKLVSPFNDPDAVLDFYDGDKKPNR